VSDHGIVLLLEALQSPSSRDAWEEFLDSYSGVLYQIARACTSNDDAAADCYLHICEQLAQSRFRRLLKFKPDGTASFTTWLRVVARNLCFDWHRSQSGRPRPFKSLQRLSGLELEVYNWRFVKGSTQEETLQQLESVYPGVSLSEISSIEERLQGSLTSRQQWILGARRESKLTPVAVESGDGEDRVVDVADPRPNQETQLADQQQQALLQKSFSDLPAQERLLLQLRFEQELSLHEIARLCGLQDAQQVHRRLAAILKKLRRAMK
jgi:RNA polymerase sigma factor (sigma-70 family)